MSQRRFVLSLWKGPILVTVGEDHRPRRGSRMDLTRILEDVCLERGLTAEEVKGPCRYRELSLARQAFMARAYATGRYSLPSIGGFLNRDHTTVLHGIRAHRQRAAA